MKGTRVNIMLYQTYRNILKTVLKNAKKIFYENKFKEHKGNMGDHLRTDGQKPRK